LDVSSELASLQPLLTWLYDAAEQLREGARILRGDEDPGYREPIPGYVAPEDDSGSDLEWDFEVGNQFLADEFIDLASKDELSEEDISRLQGLLDYSDENPDFAAYIIDSMGVEDYLRLTQEVQAIAEDSDGDAKEDANNLLDSMGNILTAAMWVPGRLTPGSEEYQSWIENTPQGQRYQERLNAFNNAGQQQLDSGDGTRAGFGVALDLLERSEVPIDQQFFEQTMQQLSGGQADRLMMVACETNPEAVDHYLFSIYSTGEAKAEWAENILNKGEEMTDQEAALLAAVLEANKDNEAFAVELATELGARNTLELWTDLIDPENYSQVSDGRIETLTRMQDSLGAVLGTATRSDDPRMDDWEDAMIDLGDERIEVANPWQPFGFQLMSDLMTSGEYSTDFLTGYGQAMIAWEQPMLPAGEDWRSSATNYQPVIGDDFLADPMSGYMEALGHNAEASTNIFFGRENFTYIVNERMWDPESGSTHLGHALESATSGHAYDFLLPPDPHTDRNAAIGERVINFYGDNPDKMESGELIGSLANIAADYMSDIQYSLTQYEEALPLQENIAQPDRGNVQWLLEGLGKDPEAYGTVIMAQEQYTAMAVDYVINDVGGSEDGIVANVEDASEAGGQVAGILNEGRGKAVFDEGLATEEEYNGAVDRGFQWAQRIADVGIGELEKFPVVGTITAWATEDLMTYLSEDGLRREASTDAASNANDVYTQGEVRVEDATQAAARAAAEANGDLDQETIDRIGDSARRWARTGHGNGVEFSVDD
jgi:hypothetical protein